MPCVNDNVNHKPPPQNSTIRGGANGTRGKLVGGYSKLGGRGFLPLNIPPNTV